MFQFTTTTVINSQYATDYNGTPLLDAEGNEVPKFKGDTGVFTVAKVGTFKQNRVKALYKKEYEAGVREEAKLTVPTATAEDKLRLTLNVKLDGSVQAEYANYYKDILISRELNSVQLLDEEIDKFIRAQKGTLKDYPILSSFFNGIKKGTIPLFEHLPSNVAQNVSADIFNDKTFQGDIDKIFECSEKIRGQIFIADLEKAISTVQQNNNGILKNDLVLKVNLVFILI